MLILAVNVGGVEKCGNRRRGGIVQSSLQKQPASTVEERRLVFNNASRSAITSGKILLNSSLQFLMPMAGWFCVHSLAQAFRIFQKAVPWIALILLAFIGGTMIREGLHNQGEAKSLQGGALFIQGIATSIDALSVGLTIAEYELIFAVTESLIIGIVTFGLCLAGLLLGGKIGSQISGKAGIFGGIILILIGIEIFVTGII